MIIPWQVDVPQDRRPFLNWLIIVTIITAFVFQMKSIRERTEQLPAKFKEVQDRSVEDLAKEYQVDEDQIEKIAEAIDEHSKKIEKIGLQGKVSQDIKNEIIKQGILRKYFVWEKVRPFVLEGYGLKGLLGHLWLHGGLIHLLGNLLFLWVFGNAVCAKVSNVGYLVIYLALGVLAGVTHLVFQGGSAIGASGAIMGVVGMYLVFFPLNDITCFFVFMIFYRPIVHEFTLSSFWMILFWLGFDLYGAAAGGGKVAYFAHLGGFFGGVLLAILLLKMKLVVMYKDEKSLIKIWETRNEPVTALPISSRRAMPYNFVDKKPVDESLDVSELETVVDQNREIVESQSLGVEDMLSGLGNSADELIRFVCTCGKRVKAPAKYAGKTAKCPRCKKKIKIPAN